MFAAELLQQLLQAANSLGGHDGVFTCDEMAAICPASSMTAVGAAFATQGYFAQADVIEMLTLTTFGLWAPLLYIGAALGGMIGLAMGSPPKMYLWFFFGPALYQFLLGTTAPAHGVQWRVATFAQDQRQVWKLAEPGLINSNIVLRYRGSNGVNLEPTRFGGTRDPVDVSYMFLWFDELISSTVQNLVAWTGVYNLEGGRDGVSSGILPRDAGSAAGGNLSGGENPRWYLLSNLKWGMLDQITSARLHNADLRDIFSTFMSSECGDAMAEAVDKGALTIAANTKNGNLPCTIFRRAPQGNTTLDCRDTDTGADYITATDKLKDQAIPIPPTLRTVWDVSVSPTNPEDISLALGSFPRFFGAETATSCSLNGCMNIPSGNPPEHVRNITNNLRDEDNINCADFFYFMVNGFRWEAAQIFYQLVATAPAGLTDDDVVFNFFYGWDIRKKGDNGVGELLNADERRQFIQNLILIHLLRNEMAITKPLPNRRFESSTQHLERGADRAIAESGSKAKYGEVYTWALMIPYIQGVLLYLLAMAYPFACVLMVVPGWHKTLFTWMSFWAWVKIWDLGFAIVMVLERSIWSMLGNNSQAARLAGLIVPMQDWGQVYVSYCIPGVECPVIPEVADMTEGSYGKPSFEAILKIFDRAFLLANGIDLDLQNAYYIYIMAALYFAIPAVTGQLVLGAKAGAASMVSGLVQGAQNDGGGGAKSMFTGELGKFAQATAGAVDQESKAKHKRAGGINNMVGQALEAGNRGLDMGIEGAMASTGGQIAGLMGSQLGLTRDRMQSALQLGQAMRARQLWTIQASTTSGAARDNAGSTNRDLSSVPITQAPPLEGAPGGATNQGKGSGAGGWAQYVNNAQQLAGGAALVNDGLNIAGNVRTPWLMADPQTNHMVASANWAAAQLITGRQAGLNAQQAMLGADGFRASTAERGYGAAERRLGSGGDFAAENAAWRDRRDAANHVGGYLAALGVDSSAMSPGSKPTDTMGMAMTGMLGSSMKAAAGYATPGSGGYWGSRSQYVSAMYGAANGVAGAYSPWSLEETIQWGEGEQRYNLENYATAVQRK